MCLSLLQHPEQSYLSFLGKVADLIQENCSAVGGFEPPVSRISSYSV